MKPISEEEKSSVRKPLEEFLPDFDKFMRQTYHNLMRIGTATEVLGEENLDYCHVLLAICYDYFKEAEDYHKAGKLHTLMQHWRQPKKVVIDIEIINKIMVHPN